MSDQEDRHVIFPGGCSMVETTGDAPAGVLQVKIGKHTGCRN